MANNCCKYFTVSLVPIAALILAVVFGCAVVALPVLWIQLATKTVVCWLCVWGGRGGGEGRGDPVTL